MGILIDGLVDVALAALLRKRAVGGLTKAPLVHRVGVILTSDMRAESDGKRCLGAVVVAEDVVTEQVFFLYDKDTVVKIFIRNVVRCGVRDE